MSSSAPAHKASHLGVFPPVRGAFFSCASVGWDPLPGFCLLAGEDFCFCLGWYGMMPAASRVFWKSPQNKTHLLP